MSNDETVYLDYAAATPLSDVAIMAMQPYLTDKFYNPSSPYAPAVEVRREYDAAKQQLAEVIGGRADDVIMTAGATESINLAVNVANDDEHIVTTAIEHHAVLGAVEKHPHTIVPVGRNGIVEPAAIEQAITPETTLVSVALANNEIGTVQPLRRIADVITAERHRRQQQNEKKPIWLHSDASQGIGQIDINVARLGVDLLTVNAAKCYGPKQVGLLWRSHAVTIRPLIVGGGQELGLRSGTENVAGTIGFAAALNQADAKRKMESRRLETLRNDLERRLTSGCPDVTVTIPHKKRLPGSLHIFIDGIDAERLVFLLEAKGVFVATGSACAANSASRSHVLKAIGLTDSEADGSLRLTLGRMTSEEDITRASSAILEAITSEQGRRKR